VKEAGLILLLCGRQADIVAEANFRKQFATALMVAVGLLSRIGRAYLLIE